jgi:TRAP-type C4-dicarboxylate transport system substrate-binding protein
MKKTGIFIISLVLILGLLVAGCTSEPSPSPSPSPVPTSSPEPTPEPTMEPVTWLYNGGIHSPASVQGRAIQWFGEQVEERTDGLITFDYVWSFGLTKPGEELDALQSRLCDLEQICWTYYPSKMFLSNITYAIPFVPEDIESLAKTINTLYRTPPLVAEREQYGDQLLWIGVEPGYYLESRMPIPTLAEFEGKKIAISGVYAPEWVEVTGATPVPTTLLDRPTALQTGMLDGSILGLSVGAPFKLYEFAPYDTHLKVGCWSGTHGAINLDLFNSLPEDVQQILLEVGEETGEYYYQIIVEEEDALREMMETAGNTFYTLSDEDIADWMELIGNAPARWIEDGEALGLPAEEVMNQYLDLIAETGYEFPTDWSSLS